MTEQVWSDLYTGNERDRVEAGTYRVKVEAARDAPSEQTLFLDLRVLDGPAVDKLVQVNLYIPKPGENAAFYFANKIAGFRTTPEVVEAYKAAANANDFPRARRVVGDNIVDQFVVAEIGVQGGDSGDAYAGRNEIVSTRPDTGQVVMFPGGEKAETETPPAPPPAPAPPAPPEEPPPAPPEGNGSGEGEDVEALRAKLAAAEAAKKNSGDPVASASAEVGGEEPF